MKCASRKVKEYKEKFANPYVAASKGYIDSVIAPEETRNILLHAIEVSGRKSCTAFPARSMVFPHFNNMKRK